MGIMKFQSLQTMVCTMYIVRFVYLQKYIANGDLKAK